MRFKNWKNPIIKHGKFTKWFWVVYYPETFYLGKYTDIGIFTFINAKFGITINDFVEIGSHCVLYSENTIDKTKGNIILNKNVKIGSHTVILPNVEIGENSIIGANSLVKKNIPKNSVYAGTPLKFIKKLK